jgi:hypothetical protein
MPSVEHILEMARIEKDFAVTKEFAKKHPHEAASRTAQKELAQFLVGVKPPRTPEDPGTPQYQALNAHTKYNEILLAVLTAPDRNSYNPETNKFETEETTQNNNERQKLLRSIEEGRKTNPEFRAADSFLNNIDSKLYRAERSRIVG